MKIKGHAILSVLVPMVYTISMAPNSDIGLGFPANRILLVLGQMPMPVELLDCAANVLYCNLAYTKAFLSDTAEILDRPTRVFPEVMPEGTPRQSVLQQAGRDGLWKGEAVVRGADGESLPVRLVVFPIRHPTDRLVEFAVFYEDIRQELETRAALAQQQNLLAIRSRQAQMGELLSMIAHQWRQPLTVVGSLVGNIQLKNEMGTLDLDFLQTKLEKISETVQFLSETIDSFRNFYMPTKEKKREDVRGLVIKARDLLEPTFQSLGIRLELELPELGIWANLFSGEFLQVILELMTNARDAVAARPAGSGFVKIVAKEAGEDFVVSVENNGGEISPELVARIYDPYFTTKGASSGTGLGLYMAKIIVENHHNGTLSARSSDGKTVFACRISKER